MTSVETTLKDQPRDAARTAKTKQLPPPKSTFLDYFVRPGDGGILREPLDTVRAAWWGSNLPPNDWRMELTADQAAELTTAVQHAAVELGEDTDLAQLTVSDCDMLPAFLRTDILPRLKHELGDGVHGRGVQVLRGVPVADWTRREQELFFWMLGLLVGRPGAQDADGLLLQHVRDTGADPTMTRKYKTRDAIDVHCDAADVVGLFCLQSAARGGTSRIISSVAVYNEFVQRYGTSRPDMVERLYHPVPMDVRSDTFSYLPVTPVRYAGNGQLRTFYMKEYFASAYRHEMDPPAANGIMPELDQEVLQAFNEICEDPKLHLDMEFRPGDIQFLNNHVTVHARTAYEDQQDANGDSSQQQRHLLRLWLAMPEEQRRGEQWQQAVSRKLETIAIVARVLWGKLRYRRAQQKHAQPAERFCWPK